MGTTLTIDYVEKITYIFNMENHNTIRIEENKIILTTPEEHQTFEPLRTPNYAVGSQFFNYQNVRYFLTKTKPNKTT